MGDIVYKIFLAICTVIILVESWTWIKSMREYHFSIKDNAEWCKYLQSTIDDGVKLAEGSMRRVAVILTFILMATIYTIPYYKAYIVAGGVIGNIIYFVLATVYLINIRNILIVGKMMHKRQSDVATKLVSIQLLAASITSLLVAYYSIKYIIFG